VIDAEQGFVIRDLVRDGERLVIARGGKGGYGNMHFKSATNRAPRERTLGADGEVRQVVLELKSIADVGLIGKPNAGKSTLLSRLSRARPEIADYPFTTKFPNLGQVEARGRQHFILADIPGLIEGASDGVGLGHEFLKHVERAGILVHLIEPAPLDETDPLQNYRAIREELESYSSELVGRPEVLAITKAELPQAADVAVRFRQEFAAAESPRTVHCISAVTGQGLSALVDDVWERLQATRAAAAAAGEPSFALEESATADLLRPAGGQPRRRPKRRPPHLAGPTAELSDENPPSRYVDPEGEDS
jgi:GTP-binding protein